MFSVCHSRLTTRNVGEGGVEFSVFLGMGILGE